MCRALVLLAGLVLATVAWANPPEEPTLYVRADADDGGDGSQARPFQRLSQALVKHPARVRLGPGVYRERVAVSAPLELEGEPGAIIEGPTHQVLVHATERLTLRRVVLRGGRTALQLDKGGSLERVEIHNPRERGVEGRGGELSLNDVRLETEAPAKAAIEVSRRSRSLLVGSCVIRGPWHRGVHADGARITVQETRFEGVRTAVAFLRGTATVSRVTSTGTGGPAFTGSQGTLELHDVDVEGHDYALLAGPDATVIARRFSSARAVHAGLALVGSSKLDGEDILVRDSGNLGAIQLVSSTARLSRFQLHRPEAYGVLSRSSSFEAKDGLVLEVRKGDDEGDGLYFRGGKAEISGVRIQGAQGSGVFAGEGARVTIRDTLIENVTTAIHADQNGFVEAKGLQVKDIRGPALVAEAQSTVQVEGIQATAAPHLASADCQHGGRVFILAPDGGTQGPHCAR